MKNANGNRKYQIVCKHHNTDAPQFATVHWRKAFNEPNFVWNAQNQTVNHNCKLLVCVYVGIIWGKIYAKLGLVISTHFNGPKVGSCLGHKLGIDI